MYPKLVLYNKNYIGNISSKYPLIRGYLHSEF